MGKEGDALTCAQDESFEESEFGETITRLMACPERRLVPD
jgi:hypothetical protein